MFAQHLHPNSPLAPETTTDTTTARLYVTLAEEFSRHSRLDSSSYYFEKASKIYEEAGFKYRKTGIWVRFVECFNEIGYNLQQLWEYDRALQYLNKAATVGTTILGNNHPVVAETYSRIAIVQSRKGDSGQAFTYHKRALRIRRAHFGKSHPLVAQSYNNLGVEYMLARDYEQAQDNLDQALSIKQSQRNLEAYEIARTEHNLGLLHYYLGNYERSLILFLRAQPAFLSELGERHLTMAQAHENIANVYRNLGQPESALIYYEKSLQIYDALLDNMHLRIAAAAENVADALSRLDRVANAENHYSRALEIYRNYFGEEHLRTAKAYFKLGELFATREDYVRGMQYFRSALTIRRALLGDAHEVVARTYRAMALAELDRGDVRAGLQHLQSGLITLLSEFDLENIYANPSLDSTTPTTELIELLYLKAKLFEKLYHSVDANHDPNAFQDYIDLETALSTYEQTASLVDKLQAGFNAPSLSDSLDALVDDVYDSAIHASMQLAKATGDHGYWQDAFRFSERRRASDLLQSAQDTLIRQYHGVPDSVLAAESSMRMELSQLHSFYNAEVLLGQNADSTRLRLYKDRFDLLRSEYAGLVDTIALHYPEYYQFKYEAQIGSLTTLVGNTLKADEAVLAYYVSDSTLYIFGVTVDGLQLATVPYNHTLVTRIAQLEKAILESELVAFRKLANYLFERLVRPFEDLLSKNKITIIPHRAVSQVPFEALLTSRDDRSDYRKLPYLIEEVAISYAYSAAHLNAIEQDKLTRTFGYLGFASSAERGSRALQEVRTLSDLYQQFGRTVQVLASQGASRTAFIDSKFDQQAVLHIAVELKSEDGLALHFAPQSSADNGTLPIHELFNLQMNPQVVVLTRVDVQADRHPGRASLAAQLWQAGANTQLHNLWAAGGEGTTVLLASTFERRLSGVSLAESIQSAKLEFIRDKQRAEPIHWANLIMFGR